MHECPDCGQVCHCNGDIDDMTFDDDETYFKCEHHLECDREEDDSDWEPADDVCEVCAEYGQHTQNCPRRGAWK